MDRLRGIGTRTALVGVLTLLAGCGSGKPKYAAGNPPEMNLRAIGSAYVAAAEKLNRAPKGLDEIKPFLSSEDVLRSPVDGEEYVIIWGMDPRGKELAPKGGQNPILIYEKKGSGGKRWVCRAPTLTEQVSDSDFAKAYFAGGHKPAP
jgi:hypothetical protein